LEDDSGFGELSAAPGAKLRVLFIQTATWTGSGLAVQADLMKFFDHSRVEAHVAYNTLVPRPAARSREPWDEGYRPGTSVQGVLQAIPGVRLRPTEFGPHVTGVPKLRLASEVGLSIPRLIRDSIGLVRYIRRNRIDVIHAGEQAKAALYGWWLARAAGAKCVIHMHVKYDDWISPLTRWAMRHADAVVGVSEWCSAETKRAGVPSQRIFTVHNGMDMAGWDPVAVDGDVVRQEFGVGPDCTLLVAMGALRPWKGHVTLLNALQRVVSTHRNVKLLIVGTEDRLTGPRPDSYTEELKRLVASSGLSEHVIFAGLRRDVREIHAAADIFALPTYEEPFGLVFLEAMAMATPVVAVASGGVPEVVEHGKTGLLAPPADSEQFARHIITLLDDPARAREMGDNGRRRLLGCFTAQTMAQGFEQLYATLAQHSDVIHEPVPRDDVAGEA
jgi:glycosyltransferase involved in cell wall biosynthesis